MSEKQAKALNILQNCLPEINPLCVCTPCFIRIVLLSMAKCCCVFGKIETCLRCTRDWKYKNTVMNNAFFANNLTVENRFQFRVYRFLFSSCSSHWLWQIWTGFTLINLLEIHLFGCRCALLPSLADFFSTLYFRVDAFVTIFLCLWTNSEMNVCVCFRYFMFSGKICSNCFFLSFCSLVFRYN